MDGNERSSLLLRRSYLPRLALGMNGAIVPRLVLFQQALHDTADICIRNGDRVFLVQPLAEAVDLHSYICDERSADQERSDAQGRVDRNGISIEYALGQRVDTGLGKVDEARETDDGAVDAAERGEAEDLGGVVGHGGVVERSEEDEEDDVDVAGPQSWNGADDANCCYHDHDDEKDTGCADIVKEGTEERRADHAC